MTKIVFVIFFVLTLLFASPIQQARAFSDDQQIYCLAEALYFEARGQKSKGVTAVALVIMNRTRDAQFPSTVCGVIYQPGQFSYRFDGLSDVPKQNAKWNKVYSIASTVYNQYDSMYDFTKGAISFHNLTVNPGWNNLAKTVTIGDHVFYKKRKKKQ